MNHEIAPEPEREQVLLTGGTEGIGRCLARELVKQNHDVVVCARTPEQLELVQAENKIEAIQLDLGDLNKIKEFVEQSAAKMGGITVVILNAAVSGIRESEDYTLRVNRDAQKVLIESAARLLRASNGRIVFMTSPQAEHPSEDNLAYGNSKRAVEDWLKEFSSQKENQNIHIFSINPGPVDTKMHTDAIEYGGDVIKQRSIKIKAEGKLRDPQIIGLIVSKMSISGKKFNVESRQYDIPIKNNEVVTISDENIEFEKHRDTNQESVTDTT